MSERVFEHRGFMLDVCRHYMPVEHIKRLILAAAACGMNRMHWHLTDDQGWRIEIRRYPRLTEIGARRGDSFFGGVSTTENNCGFYTQDEAREIVAFARENGLEVIPEIELPGHATAMLAAYPEYGCRRADGGGYAYRVARAAGIFPNLLCAGRDECLRFIEAILDEIVDIFPFPVVHIGGDEAPKLRWRRCPDCQRRMAQEGLKTEDDLQRWLVLRVGAYLEKKGRRTIVWNDVLLGGLLPKHFIVQQWLGDAPQTRAFMAAGGQVICSDTENHYFDYPYGEIDVHRIWEHPLIPDYAKGSEDRLLGVECPLWTERVTNLDRAAYLLFPRLAAMGLRLRGDDSPDWETFASRVEDAMKPIRALGLDGAPRENWRMSPRAAEADRAAEDARIHAPEAMPYVRWEKGIVHIEKVERLMEAIGMPRPFALRVGDALLAENDGNAPDTDPDGALELGRQLSRAVENRESGCWRRMPGDVWIATLKAFSRFVDEYHRDNGSYAFDRGFWTPRQVEARLFRLGELEYELRQNDDGSRQIDLHIPSDARLTPEGLNASVEYARTFLAEYFPEWRELPMRCESWLLSPALDALLDGKGRILTFKAAFDIDEIFPDNREFMRWIFGRTQGDLRALPENTTLQRRAKALLLAGGNVGAASGTLARRFG